jgi:hypothetical protein
MAPTSPKTAIFVASHYSERCRVRTWTVDRLFCLKFLLITLIHRQVLQEGAICRNHTLYVTTSLHVASLAASYISIGSFADMHFAQHSWKINKAKLHHGSGAGYCQYTVWLRTGRSRFDSRQTQRIFPLASVSRPALGPTQPPVHWILGVKRGRGVTLTTHPHLVPRSRMSRSYTSSPHKRLRSVWWNSFSL